MSDSIADALIRIKNSYLIGKEEVSVKYSKVILRIIKLLQKEGYVSGASKKDNEILVSLRYVSRKPAITDLKRVSKPSLRVYLGVKDLPKVLSGLGIAIISTPKGIMTDSQARKQNIGGEVIALVW